MARLFRSNRSQAVRLPKEAEFPAEVSDVDVVVHGQIRILVPRITSWRQWFEQGPRLSEDFAVERDNRDQVREFLWP